MTDDSGFMVPISDTRTFDALAHAPSDPEAAATVLRIAARYLRRLQFGGDGPQFLPDDLAGFLANAFERTARVPAKARPKVLAQALHLTAPGRRLVGSPFHISSEVYDLVLDGIAPTAACAIVAEKHDCSKDTVEDYWRRYADAFEIRGDPPREQGDDLVP